MIRVIGVLYLANVVFLSAALKWVIDKYKKGCTCAQNWRLRYLQYFFTFNIIFSTISFLMVAVRPKVFLQMYQSKLKYLLPLSLVGSVVSASIALSYFVDLEKSDCVCAKDKQERFMYIMSIVQVIFAGLQVFGGFALGR